MKHLKEFDQARTSLAWAVDAINELQFEFSEFFQPRPKGPILDGEKAFAKVVEIDPETGYEIHKFKVFRQIPNKLARRATEALNNTRHSFDQAVFAACSAIGQTPKSKKTYFPWRTTPTDLDATLGNSHIPEVLWDTIRREEPYYSGESYTGGDDLARDIAKLANGKHTVGLAVLPNITSVMYPYFGGDKIDFAEVKSPRWDKSRNEAVLAIVSPGAEFKGTPEISLDITLDVSGPLEHTSAIGALRYFAARAERFIDRIEAKCVEILDK